MGALKDHHVLVDPTERKTVIVDQLSHWIPSDHIDQGLLNEVNQLVEWPTALDISFPESFLELPEEVLIECLRKHQKAFMLMKDKQPAPACLVIADSVTE